MQRTLSPMLRTRNNVTVFLRKNTFDLLSFSAKPLLIFPFSYRKVLRREEFNTMLIVYPTYVIMSFLVSFRVPNRKVKEVKKVSHIQKGKITFVHHTILT